MSAWLKANGFSAMGRKTGSADLAAGRLNAMSLWLTAGNEVGEHESEHAAVKGVGLGRDILDARVKQPDAFRIHPEKVLRICCNTCQHLSPDVA